MPEHVDQNLRKNRKVRWGRFRIETGVIFGGESIDKPTQYLDRRREIASRPRLSSFEQKVLQKMRDAAELLRFVSTADSDPNANADTFHLRHFAGSDPHPVFQSTGSIKHQTVTEWGERKNSPTLLSHITRFQIEQDLRQI